MRRGFLLFDVVVGMCIATVVAGVVFFWTKNQKNTLKRFHLLDLAHRTVVNVLVRDLVSPQSELLFNGFELVRRDGKIVLKFNNQLFLYEVEGDKR